MDDIEVFTPEQYPECSKLSGQRARAVEMNYPEAKLASFLV
jgi:hypothetical protein